MSKASSVVASVMQQSRQRVPWSWTEYRERTKATWVQTLWWHDELVTSVAERRWCLCHLGDRNAIGSCTDEAV